MNHSTSRIGRARNGLARRLGNFAINHVATRWYGERLALIVKLGEKEYVKRIVSGDVSDLVTLAFPEEADRG